MKKMLALAIVALMAGSASAQLGMGLFFSNTDFTPENTNFDSTPGVPFDAFIVVMGLGEANTPEGVGAYEVGITISDATVFVLSATGPNGWTNFGSSTNHIVGYATPVIADGNGVAIVGQLQLLYSGADLVNISFGAATPSSVDGAGPAITDSADPEIIIQTGYTTGDGSELTRMVATMNGAGVTATEARSLSNVKALFD